MNKLVGVCWLALWLSSAALFSCGADNALGPLVTAADGFAGSYELGDNRFVALGPLGEAEGRLLFTEFPSGRTGFLHPQSGNNFYAGPSFREQQPIELRVSFRTGGPNNAPGLSWSAPGQPERFAPRNPYRQQSVSFRNGGVSLQGTLLLPAGKGPHPAIVMIHGSGRQTREMGYMPYVYLRHGIAVLTYDKRGSGASTGDEETAGIEDLAGDALAGLRLLRTHPEINPQQIGVRGDSQGGWVAPTVAARAKEKEVAFVIVRSASGLPVQDNLAYEVENAALNRGFSAAEAKQVGEFRRQLNSAIITNSGWDTLAERLRAVRNEPWFELSQAGWVLYRGAPGRAMLAELRNYFIFDPAPQWERVTCPVLVLLGEVDRSVPSAESAVRLKQALEKGGNKDFTITIFPKGNHGLLEAETGFDKDAPQVKRLVPGYLDGMLNWVLKRVTVQRP